ncbi:hypothetical protein PG995_013564 [Apiospora arundinis]
MFALWKSTMRSLSADECAKFSSSPPPRPGSSNSSQWRISGASTPERASTIIYLRHRRRALIRACHGGAEEEYLNSSEDLDEFQEDLDALLDIEDDDEFAAETDRVAGMITFRFSAMRLATTMLRNDMRDYFRSCGYEVELPGHSPCAGWNEAAWEAQMTELFGAVVFVERRALVRRLMEDAGLTEMNTPFRAGLNQGWTFVRPLRYLAAGLVGSGIPSAELPVAVRNLAKACRARAVGGCIPGGEEKEEDDDNEKIEEEATRPQRIMSSAWSKATGFFKKAE